MHWEVRGAYRASRLRLKVRLQVQGGVEIAAGVAAAAALDGVHAHGDGAVRVRGHGTRGVREPALRLRPLARATLELAAHLRTPPRRTQRQRPDTLDHTHQPPYTQFVSVTTVHTVHT